MMMMMMMMTTTIKINDNKQSEIVNKSIKKPLIDCKFVRQKYYLGN